MAGRPQKRKMTAEKLPSQASDKARTAITAARNRQATRLDANTATVRGRKLGKKKATLMGRRKMSSAAAGRRRPRY